MTTAEINRIAHDIREAVMHEETTLRQRLARKEITRAQFHDELDKLAAQLRAALATLR